MGCESALLCLVLLQLVTGILGWGKEGHYATCKIAEAYLSEEALAAVKELLPVSAEGDLAAVCSWADQVRFHYHWSSALHYVDTPDFKCNYEYCRDCHDGAKRKDRCVTGAIYNYTYQLTDGYQTSKSNSNYNLTEALMFLSHFIGDAHQPLHTGFLGDLGGNTITVRWYRRKTNLHHVWDNMIIESAMKTFYDNDLAVMIQSIQNNITDDWRNQQTQWQSCERNQTACPNLYASESVSLACKYAYRNATPGSTLKVIGSIASALPVINRSSDCFPGRYTLGIVVRRTLGQLNPACYDYFLTRLPIVEKRLAQGGIRLAATLNRIFPSQLKVAQM